MSVRGYIFNPAQVRRAVGVMLPLLCVLLAGTIRSEAQSFQDMFTNRETIVTASGTLLGDNTTATVEPGEPLHDGKRGGHSLWISWVAPTNGIARFQTEGSGFDTLLAAYYFLSTNDTTFDKLIEAGRADDSEGLDHESEIEFGVLMGHHYEIAVDGYFGATGPVQLNWRIDPSSVPPPIVLSTPPDRSVKIGDAVSWTVVVTNGAVGQYEWLFNGNETGIKSTNFSIASVQATNTGRYKLQITITNSGGLSYFAVPTELQIDSEGATNTLAQDKLLDSPSTPLVGEDGSGPSLAALFRGPLIGVIRGYNGSQIFDTTYATTDPNEPQHCGVVGGSSYWLAYYPPTNGTITMDTIGSTYDTVMEAYTYNFTPTNYSNLISLACDNDGVSLHGPSRISFPVLKSRQYVIVVDGVNGARGTAWLNYSLDTNQPPVPPRLLSPPGTNYAVPGSSVTLSASWTASAPLQCSWQKNQALMPGFNSSTLLLTNLATTDSANYFLNISNDLGSLSILLPLRVLIPPQVGLTHLSNGLALSWPTVTGQVYTIEEANSVLGPWVPWTNSFLGDGQTNTVNLGFVGTRFFRLWVQ